MLQVPTDRPGICAIQKMFVPLLGRPGLWFAHASLVLIWILPNGLVFGQGNEIAKLGQRSKDYRATPVDRRTKLKLLSDAFDMADGPMFDGRTLVIPDVKGEKLYRYVPNKQELSSFPGMNGRFSSTFFNHGRRFVSDNPGGRIAFIDGNQLKTVASFEQWTQADAERAPAAGQKRKKPRPYRPNDLVVDNQGGIYVTFTPQGRVIYIAPDGKQSVAIDGIDTPNGITLSPDESTIYVSSFIPKQIFAYQVLQPGKLDDGKLFAAMDQGPERGADGMTIDRAGNVYCAGPTAVWIWSPSGKLLDKIVCPTKPINCTFGGQNLRTLYIAGPGGLYEQPMNISGVAPQAGVVNLAPPATVKFPAQTNVSIPSTSISSDQIARTHLDVVYGQVGDRKLLCDIFVPAAIETHTACIVVVHGGGWHKGDKKKFRALALELCRRGYVTAAIEYRLADEAAFPAGMQDCSAAVRFLRANAKQYQIDPDRIGAVGGSAGGHLVGLMAAGARNKDLQGTAGNPNHSSEIGAAIVLAGPLQIATGPVAEKSLDESKFSNARSWMRGNVRQQPELYRLADAFEQIDSKTCPILFQVGEFDNPERNQASRDKLKQLGIATGLKIYADGKHGCWNRKPWFGKMAEDMDKFFQQTLR